MKVVVDFSTLITGFRNYMYLKFGSFTHDEKMSDELTKGQIRGKPF